MMIDILKWFLIMFFGLFILWIITGGPARGGGTNPIITAPVGIGNPGLAPQPAPGTN